MYDVIDISDSYKNDRYEILYFLVMNRIAIIVVGTAPRITMSCSETKIIFLFGVTEARFLQSYINKVLILQYCLLDPKNLPP